LSQQEPRGKRDVQKRETTCTKKGLNPAPVQGRERQKAQTDHCLCQRPRDQGIGRRRDQKKGKGSTVSHEKKKRGGQWFFESRKRAQKKNGGKRKERERFFEK